MFLKHIQLIRVFTLFLVNVYIFWPRIASLTGLPTIKVLNGLDFFDFISKGVLNFDLLLIIFIFFIIPPIFGRAFCGWLCHIALLQDLGEWILNKTKFNKLRWKKYKIVQSDLLVIILPSTVLIAIIIPAIYKAFITNGWITNSNILIEWFGHVNPNGEEFPGTTGLLFVWFTIGIIIVGMFGKRPFCRYVCYFPPMGLKRLQKWGRYKVRKVGDCIKGCQKCSKECPVGIDVSKEVNQVGYVASLDCMSCFKCISGCPTSKSISFTTKTGNERPYVAKNFPYFKQKTLSKRFESLTIIVAFYVTYKMTYLVGERGMMIDWMSIVLCGTYFAYSLFILVKEKIRKSIN